MEMPVGGLVGDLGEVEPLGSQLLGPGGSGKLGLAGAEDVVDLRFGRIQCLPGLLAGVGLQIAQGLASRHQRGALSGHCGPHRAQFIDGGRGRRLALGLDHQLLWLSHRTPL